MHKQSQRQKRTKIIICHFKELGCLGEALISDALSPSGDTGHSAPTLPRQARGCPSQGPVWSAVPLFSSKELYLSWHCWRGNAAFLPALHRPPRRNPGHMLTAYSMLGDPSACWDLEQRQPRDWPLANVTMNWEVRTYPALPPHRDCRVHAGRGPKQFGENWMLCPPSQSNPWTARNLLCDSFAGRRCLLCGKRPDIDHEAF